METAVNKHTIIDLAARPGEHRLGILPNGVPEFMADYAADKVSKEEGQRMREEQAKIWALGEYQARVEGFRAQGRIMRDFSENCTNWVALQNLYDLGRLGAERLLAKLGGVLDADFDKDIEVAQMWFSNFDNAAGVRERGEVAKQNIIETAREAYERNSDRPVRIGSIACGSSHVVLEAMKQLKEEGIPVIGRMVDMNEEALTYTQQRAQEMGLGEVVKTMRGNVVRLNGEFAGERFDALEAVGIMDYFDDKLSHLFLRQMHKLLKQGGTLVASCIMNNPEREFLHGAVGWPAMVYRTPEEFADLFVQAGFQAQNCKSIRIPNGLYTMMVARIP